MQHYDVYGIGNALLDIEFEVTPSFLNHHGIQKGLMTLISQERQTELLKALATTQTRHVSCAGSAANALIALQQLGGQAFFSCKIAADKNGDDYYQNMQMAGLHSNVDIQPRSPGTTGTCLVMLTEDADRTMNTYLGITETLSTQELHEAALKNSTYLYLEGYPVTSDTALEALNTAKKLAEHHGVKTALTLSDQSIVKFFKARFHYLLAQGVDLLFCNELEALELTDTRLLDAAQSALTDIARQFVITRDARGSILFDGNRFITIPAHPVKAIDTLGAGDGYAGAFLYALTHGYSFEAAGHLASRVAAQVVSQYGPRLDTQQAQAILQAF